MNARITPIRPSRPQQARVALLGTGVVGSAVWSRLADWSRTPLAERLSLVHVTNSRFGISNPDGLAFDTHELLMRNAPRPSSLDAIDDALGDSGLRIVIDATASEAVAEQHAHWLASGVCDQSANRDHTALPTTPVPSKATRACCGRDGRIGVMRAFMARLCARP